MAEKGNISKITLLNGDEYKIKDSRVPADAKFTDTVRVDYTEESLVDLTVKPYLQDNTDYQSLDTEDKTIIGAINEVGVTANSTEDYITNTAAPNFEKMMSLFGIVVRLKSYLLNWNSTTTITIPSTGEPCFFVGNRGSGSTEKGFIFFLSPHVNEYMAIKNSAGATINSWNPATGELRITLGAGTGSNVWSYAFYWAQY